MDPSPPSLGPSPSQWAKENPTNVSPAGSFKSTSGRVDPPQKTTDTHTKFVFGPNKPASPEKSQPGKLAALEWPIHNKYCFSDGSLKFLVAGCMFNVHRHLFVNVNPRLLLDFRNTLHFPTTFPSLDRIWKGTSEPILVDNFPLRDMEFLLWALYESQYTEVPDDPVATWSSVLLTSYQWGLSRLFLRAVKELEPLTFPDPVYKIQLARTCRLSEKWALNANTDLNLRKDSLALEEGRKIGLENALIIAECRERIIRGNDSTLVLSELADVLSNMQSSPQRTIRQISPQA